MLSSPHLPSLLLALGLGACVRDARDLHAARTTRERAPTGMTSSSWGLCSLIGPHNRSPGVWGTDLGFNARARDDKKLTLLFGDTWAKPVTGCQYPVTPNDDLQATLPVARPALFRAGPPATTQPAACDFLEYAQEQAGDVTSWRRIRLFPSATAHSDDASFDMSALRTPVAAFSDGERLMGLFYRNDPVSCLEQSECPSGMQCSIDPAYRGIKLGECARGMELSPGGAPDYCRTTEDCVTGLTCNPATRGVCLATKPFDVKTPQGPVVPTWYHDDPRRGIARTLYVGAAIWPDKPADYATLARFSTNRFQNVAARSVTYFDPEHPENNDYRPGYHTLLLWGRSSFVESGGAQALPFLLYVPLSELRGAPEAARWRPRFFAGYSGDGKPLWSERESDARPIYGDQARLVEANGTKLEWAEPEFDQVEQMTVSWVEPLQRWVMFYGGDLPAFMVLDPHTGKARQPVHLQWAPGAIHMRTAQHPWGSAREIAGEPGWSSAEPILTRQLAAPYLACGSGGPDGLPGCVKESEAFRPFVLMGALVSEAASGSPAGFADVAASCIGGEFARKFQDTLSGDQIGRLYAPQIIDDWTQDVTEASARARGEGSAEIYWNVSTWNPYQVVLFKTKLTAHLR